MWITIIEIGLKIVGYIFGFLGNKAESKIWMAKASEILRQKGLVRSKFVLELEADSEAYLEQKMMAMGQEPDRPSVQPEPIMEPTEPNKNGFKYSMPEIIRVPGIQFKTRGKFKTSSGKAKGVLVHYTVSGGTKASAIAVLKSLAKRGLGCPVMDHDGVIYVPEDYDLLSDVVYHAGKSAWLGKTGVSLYCVGMEICNWGKLNATTKPRAAKIRNDSNGDQYEAYTEKQEEALLNFILYVADSSPDYENEWLCGHHEVSPDRKTDPKASLSMSMDELRLKVHKILNP
jgi:N-acetyl-anhydromuramyl-L-alanine amidase AmpD